MHTHLRTLMFLTIALLSANVFAAGNQLTEDEKKATIREIKGEMGVDITIKKHIGKNEYIAADPERGKIRKQVTYFLGEAPHEELTLGESGGLDAARWFPLHEVAELNMYDDILPILTKGIKMIKK